MCCVEFMDGERYLEDVEDEFGIESGFREEEAKMTSFVIVTTFLTLIEVGPQDAPFFQSTGNFTNRSVTNERLAVQHRD